MSYREHLEDPALERWMQRFGEAVRAARRAASLSQEGLASRAFVNQSTISRLEAGKTPFMSLLRVARISIGMGGRVPLGPCPHPHECAFKGPLVTHEEVMAYQLRGQLMAQGILDPRHLDQLSALRANERNRGDGPGDRP